MSYQKRIGGAPPDKVRKVCFLVKSLRCNRLLWWPRMANCFLVLSFGIICLLVWVCESYIVHHRVGSRLYVDHVHAVEWSIIGLRSAAK